MSEADTKLSDYYDATKSAGQAEIMGDVPSVDHAEIDRLQRSVTDWRLEAEVHRKRAAAAVAEISRLREASRRLADQDATLSVCNGKIIVEMDAALSEEEHEALKEFVGICESQAASARVETADRWLRKAAVVRSLLLRFGGSDE